MTMTLCEISKLLQKSQNVVAAGIKQGLFPFVVADNVEGKKAKYIYFPGKLEEYVTGTTQEYDLNPKAVAEMLGCSHIALLTFLRLGRLPFGVAFKTSPENKQYSYVIFPAKLEEYLIARKKRLAA